MIIDFPEIGICGLSCKLCPAYHRETKSKCEGCKSESRMNVGCTFIRCAKLKRNIEFCWDCKESKTCEKWKKHREFSKNHDSFVCYQKLNDNIFFVENKGIENFNFNQNIRKKLLEEMLEDFNEEGLRVIIVLQLLLWILKNWKRHCLKQEKNQMVLILKPNLRYCI